MIQISVGFSHRLGRVDAVLILEAGPGPFFVVVEEDDAVAVYIFIWTKSAHKGGIPDVLHALDCVLKLVLVAVGGLSVDPLTLGELTARQGRDVVGLDREWLLACHLVEVLQATYSVNKCLISMVERR